MNIVLSILKSLIWFGVGFFFVGGLFFDGSYFGVAMGLFGGVVFAFDGPRIWRWLDESRDRRRDKL